WLSEPDLAEHNYAPGSPEAVAAIKAVDDDLATLLSALEKKKVRDSTDIFVVSDHGFSTIRRSIDVVALLNKAGFRAAKEFPKNQTRVTFSSPATAAPSCSTSAITIAKSHSACLIGWRRATSSGCCSLETKSVEQSHSTKFKSRHRTAL